MAFDSFCPVTNSLVWEKVPFSIEIRPISPNFLWRECRHSSIYSSNGSLQKYCQLWKKLAGVVATLAASRTKRHETASILDQKVGEVHSFTTQRVQFILKPGESSPSCPLISPLCQPNNQRDFANMRRLGHLIYCFFAFGVHCSWKIYGSPAFGFTLKVRENWHMPRKNQYIL